MSDRVKSTLQKLNEIEKKRAHKMEKIKQEVGQKRTKADIRLADHEENYKRLQRIDVMIVETIFRHRKNEKRSYWRD